AALHAWIEKGGLRIGRRALGRGHRAVRAGGVSLGLDRNAQQVVDPARVERRQDRGARRRRAAGDGLSRHRAAGLTCAWSARTWATHAVTLTPVGRSMNSFGPCALEPGPITPVTRNCACGKRSPSICMKGMEPPSPLNIVGAPK